jgi:Xaa-Pro aminopeptidase
VPRVGGYWGDSCATFTVAGEASPALRDPHARGREALARAVELVRPGARARDVDAAIRDGLDYPHHTGHGVGTAYHEEPRVVPDAGAVLEPGMVVALEPGVYGDGFGVRLEQVVLVTPDGAEILSGHSLDL